jgi:translation initiation factor IF-1
VSKDVIELIGIVEETFPNATFRVKILSPQAKDHELLCHLAGRMRVNRVHILPGDRVRVEMTPYDLQKGRITYRFRSDQALDINPAPAPATPPASPTPPASAS